MNSATMARATAQDGDRPSHVAGNTRKAMARPALYILAKQSTQRDPRSDLRDRRQIGVRLR